MTTTTIHDDLLQNDPEDWQQWRHDQLRQAGYSIADAATLALARHVDLHDATALVEAGCSPRTATRILL